MKSLVHRDENLDELQSTLESLFHYGELEPAGHLEATTFRRQGWYENTNDNIWYMNNGEVFFVDQDGCWVDRVKLIVEEKNIDIKLRAYPVTGNAFNVPVSRRTVSNNMEEVTFLIARSVSKIELMSNDQNKEIIEVTYLRIEGAKVDQLSDALTKSSLILNKMKTDSESIEHALDQKVSNLKNSIEKFTKEKTLLNGEITSLRVLETQSKATLNSIDEQINLKETFLQDLNKKFDKVKIDLDELQQKQMAVQDENNSLEIEKEELSEKLVTKSKEVREVQALLDKYKENAALFSEDFSTLKLSVLLQNSFYGAVLCLSCVFGWWLISNIYEGALTLALSIDKEELPLKAIWPLLISRLPLIAINFFLLTFLSSILIYLVKIIVKNNEETKIVKQAAYLVREVVCYQSSGLQTLTEKEIFEKRVNAKLKLIQQLIHPEQTTNVKSSTEKKDQLNTEELIKSLESTLKKYTSK
ncbi:hypothetical protein [Vibrio campbellii]|uniref:Uncharacterized protein n=3 Tax=Vibrio campbellii TaxID=680 RepID=A0ACC7RBX2_9VIBR